MGGHNLVTNPVTAADVQSALRSLGLSEHCLCVHSSLRSFGWVEGGAQTVVDSVLAEGCTLLVPTFTEFQVSPPPHLRPARNGWNYAQGTAAEEDAGVVYSCEMTEVAEEDMGATPAAVLRMPQRIRGNHPLCSFAAVGPLAEELIRGQAPLDVNAPLRVLAEAGGFVVLMGVGLEAMTLLHLAEQRAGRVLFRRWANGSGGQVIEVETGGCSDGFHKMQDLLSPLNREARVGDSRWQVFPAVDALEVASEAIRRDPAITHCGVSPCRCDDAVQGGPILGKQDGEAETG